MLISIRVLSSVYIQHLYKNYILSLPRKRPNLDVGMFGYIDVI